MEIPPPSLIGETTLEEVAVDHLLTDPSVSKKIISEKVMGQLGQIPGPAMAKDPEPKQIYDPKVIKDPEPEQILNPKTTEGLKPKQVPDPEMNMEFTKAAVPPQRASIIYFLLFFPFLTAPHNSVVLQNMLVQLFFQHTSLFCFFTS